MEWILKWFIIIEPQHFQLVSALFGSTNLSWRTQASNTSTNKSYTSILSALCYFTNVVNPCLNVVRHCLYASIYACGTFFSMGPKDVYLICMSTQLLSKYQNIPPISIVLYYCLPFWFCWSGAISWQLTVYTNYQRTPENQTIFSIPHRHPRLDSQLIYNVYINSECFVHIKITRCQQLKADVIADWLLWVESRSIKILLLLLYSMYSYGIFFLCWFSKLCLWRENEHICTGTCTCIPRYVFL